jgi:hypothetical protein
MKPGQKGWLKEYLEFRKELLNDLTSESQTTANPEQSLYRVIQPTGLMYGQSVDSIVHPDSKNWSAKDRMKVLLAESLISSSLLFYERPIQNSEVLSDVIFKTLENIGNFYNSIFPELATPSKTFLGKKKSPLEVAEKIIDKRVEHTQQYSDNFWTLFFHNSLLFLDVFIFGQWIHTNADRIVSDFFKYEREELRFSVIKIIASAAHANTTIEFEEQRLFEYFLHSSGFPPDKKKEALTIFEKGVLIEEINLPSNNSWILKKYFLEMAILTIWSDKKVDEIEVAYLRRLCEYLGFGDDDLENSMIAIEGFVLEHWHELDKLQNRQDYDKVCEQFIGRMARMAEKNVARLIRDIRTREDLMELLNKAKSNELTQKEKQHLHDLLIMVLKTLPAFASVPLPHHFLTLPILLKILPKNLFAESIES